jgi:hypothetical protein
MTCLFKSRPIPALAFYRHFLLRVLFNRLPATRVSISQSLLQKTPKMHTFAR